MVLWQLFSALGVLELEELVELLLLKEELVLEELLELVLELDELLGLKLLLR